IRDDLVTGVQTCALPIYSLMLGSVFDIEATARPGHTAQELEQAVDEELNRLREAGPDQGEIDRARNVIETRIVQGLESLGGFGEIGRASGRERGDSDGGG